MQHIREVIQELDLVVEILRQSRNGVEWASEMEQHLVDLRSADCSTRRRVVVVLRGKCHQQALGDALVADEVSFLRQVAKLREACDRALKTDDNVVA